MQNLTDHLGGAQIYAKMVSDANGGAHKIYNAITHAMLCKRANKNIYVRIQEQATMERCFLWLLKIGLGLKVFMGLRDIKRQKPNCDAMRSNGAEIIPVDWK